MARFQTTPAHALPIARPAPVPAGTESKPAGSPLSPADLLTYEESKIRLKKIIRAAGVARFNGWTTGIFAAFSLLGGLFSLTSFLLGVALAIVSYNEFKGGKRLLQLDRHATLGLGRNQLGFCATLVIYSVWCIYDSFNGPNPCQDALAASGGQAVPLLGSIGELYNTITIATYGAMIILSIIFQGGTAWYYYSRQKYILAYLNDTPEWVVNLQRATAG